MWSDEGLSLNRAAQTVPDIIANIINVDGIDTRDTNPPFYFLLLHSLRAAAGETVFALRFASVATATLSIPLIYVLGSASLVRRVGLVAAVLLTISPFHVWQSQIVRNYGLLITLNLFSTYGLFRYVLARPGRRQTRWLILWLAAGILGIYTHYFAFFVFAFGLLALAVGTVKGWPARRLFKQAWFWVSLGLTIAILLPVSALAISRFAAGGQIDFAYVPVSEFLAQTMSAFAVGVNWSLTHAWWRVLPVILIAVLGLWFAWRRRLSSTMLLLGYQIVPLALLYSLSYINPLYNGVRHLLIGLPPFLIFLASGIVGPGQLLGNHKRSAAANRAWRVIGPILAAIVIVNQLAWLEQQFSAPRLVRDDVRGPALYLSKHAAAEDTVVLHDTLIRSTFTYYYDGAAPVIAVPWFGETDVEAAIDTLQEVAANSERIWFLTEPTPRTGFARSTLSDWAEDNWPQIFDQRYPSMWLRVHLEGYLSGAVLTEVPDMATPADAFWTQTLRLHGTEIPAEVTAGEAWWLTFYLSQPSSIPEQHSLSLRLVDGTGREWARMDKPIVVGFPPSAAVADAMMRYDHQVIVPAGIPAGRYALQASLVRTADGATVSLSTGQIEYHVADVTVNGSSCSASAESIPADVRLEAMFSGGIELLGYDQIVGEIRPGFPLELDAWWCANRQPDADYRVRLQLIDDAGEVAAESIGSLSQQGHPTNQWQEDDLLSGSSQLMVPAEATAGSYDLQLSLLQPDVDQPVRIGWSLVRRSLPVGKVVVVPWSMETEVPPLTQSLRADFGQPTVTELHGYDLNNDTVAPGQNLELTLVWRSIAGALGTSYRTFVHLLDESGKIVTQSDSIPMSGFRPTTSWRAGEVIIDEHTLTIPIEAISGEYTLWIGLYDPATGHRLPIYVGGQEQPDGRLRLTGLTSQP